ncbi:unnamed protein product, partial [Musa banksii]
MFFWSEASSMMTLATATCSASIPKCQICVPNYGPSFFVCFFGMCGPVAHINASDS